MDLEMAHLRTATLEKRLRDALAQGTDTPHIYQQELDDAMAQRRALREKEAALAKELAAAQASKEALAVQVKRLAARLVEESRARAQADDALRRGLELHGGVVAQGQWGAEPGGVSAEGLRQVAEERTVALEDLAAEKAAVARLQAEVARVRELHASARQLAEQERERADAATRQWSEEREAAAAAEADLTQAQEDLRVALTDLKHAKQDALHMSQILEQDGGESEGQGRRVALLVARLAELQGELETCRDAQVTDRMERYVTTFETCLVMVK